MVRGGREGGAWSRAYPQASPGDEPDIRKALMVSLQWPDPTDAG